MGSALLHFTPLRLAYKRTFGPGVLLLNTSNFPVIYTQLHWAAIAGGRHDTFEAHVDGNVTVELGIVGSIPD